MYEIKKLGKDSVDYENALFVLKAMSSDKTRPFLCVVHVERMRSGSRLVATDGRRLHVAEIGMRIETGEYEVVYGKDSVILKESAETLQFPAWRRVVPDKTIDKGSVNLEQAGIGRSEARAAQMSIVFSQFMEKTGEVVNLRYLEDLPKKEWTVLSQGEKRKAVMLKRVEQGRETYAVIMPLDAAA